MTTAGRLEIGKDIILEKGEKLLTFKNKFNGELVYSTTKYENVTLDGKEFVPVFRRPISPKDRRFNYIAADAIEKVVF